MLFKNKIFIIEVDFNYKANEGDFVVQHNRLNNKIELDMKEYFETYEAFSGESLKKQFRNMIIHELTHWFDWNTSDSESWSHAGSKIYEMVAKFNELFHQHIEEFANMIMESKQVQKYIKS
jgi:hypothetical protein